MKIKFGQGVAEGRGKIGGTVYSRNASGAYARNYVKPVNPQTPAQQAVRSSFGSLSGSFRSLTEGQRNSFVTQAPNYPRQDKVGNTITLTGQQLFNAANLAILQSGGTALLTTMPPPLAALPDIAFPLSAIDTDFVPNSVELTPDFVTIVNGVPVASGSVPAGYRLVIEATRALSPGRARPKDSDYKQIATYAAGASNFALGGQATPTQGNYFIVYGAFVPNAYYGVRMRLVSLTTGQTTPWASQVFEFIPVAP